MKTVFVVNSNKILEVPRSFFDEKIDLYFSGALTPCGSVKNMGIKATSYKFSDALLDAAVSEPCDCYPRLIELEEQGRVSKHYNPIPHTSSFCEAIK